MFQVLQTEIDDRFTAVHRHLRDAPKDPSEVTATTKGLVFVQIYAVYEYTVRAVVRLGVQEIASKGYRMSELRPSLLSLFLDPDLNSLRDTAEKNVWSARLKLLERSQSNDLLTAVQTVPHNADHYRHTQLLTIFRVFGIKKPITTRKRYCQRIDEVVDNRNKIAHGHETPVEIGRTYTRQEIQLQIRVMHRICSRLVKIMEEHCSHRNGHCR